MSTLRWLRERWLEARWGLIYVSFILSFVTASTVTWTDIFQIKQIFPNLETYAVVAIIGGMAFGTLVGYAHGKYQNPTDVLKGNKPLLLEIREIVREEIERAN